MARKLGGYPFEPDYAVPPGETLSETIAELGMTQKDLARRAGLTEQSITRIINGRQPITVETAIRLEKVTGVPARLWNSLESGYQEQLAKIRERERLGQELEWLDSVPVKELIKRKAVPATKDKSELLGHVLRFYGVSSVAAWHAEVDVQKAAARKPQALGSDPGAVTAWLRLGELQAREIRCQPYDPERFRAALQCVRSLTVEEPKVFIPKVRELCASAGVAFCLVPEMRGCRWYAATQWLTPTKSMILLCLRGKREDHFWFSFFHEAGHVLLDGKKEVYLSDGRTDHASEDRANAFAQDFLIPSAHQSRLSALRTVAEVRAFARELGISPGIVVGQYQRVTQNWTHFNGLRRRFEWQEN